jgi:tetratricopeptide (TPR) repeat protein
MSQPDLAGLLAEGERTAFHAAPAAAVTALERAVVLARGQGRRAEMAAAGWLLGVALAAAGRYGAALSVLDPLVDAGQAAGPPPQARLFGALAAASVASVHRQLGRHAVARDYDRRGLSLGETAPEAAFDCHLGLAADAVGLTDPATADAELAAAAALLAGRDDWWRQQVRLDWVRAEAALLRDAPSEALGAAQAAVDRAERARAPRHVAKGLLFQGVAEVRAGSEQALGTLRRAATLAESLGALPLVWPPRAMLGALIGTADPEESERNLAAARASVLAIAQELPAGLREEWLGRPDLAALLAG